MNEEALNDSYNLFVSGGYNGSKEDYISLIQSNSDALNDSYELFKGQGYQDSIDDFTSLIGLKKKDVTGSPSEGGSSDFVKIDDDILTKATGNSFAAAGVPSFLAGFLSNAVIRGTVAGSAADETFNLMSGGKDLTDENIQKYIKINKLSESMGESKAMKEFNEKYEEDISSGDSGVWAFLKGVADNPKVAAEVMITSMAQMASSAMSSGETMAMVAAGAGAGAGIGAGLGAIGGPLAPATSTIGAIGGSIKGAMAAAGGITEVAASFTEFLKEELGGKDFTQENIRQVLENEEAKQKIINKSLARGATIAVIDFLAAGASGKAVSSVKSIGRTGKVLRGTAATGIESIGGGTGETLARVVTGQELDVKEIMFEAIGEMPGAVVSGPIGLLSAPKYNVNNSRMTKNDFQKVVNSATDEEILSMNISIDNDEAMSAIFNDRIEKAKVKKDIDPTITDANDIDTVVDLEIKIKDLKNRKTSSAKNKVKQLEQQIKDVQSKYEVVDSEQTVTEEAPVAEQPIPKAVQTVADVINRPVTLTSLGGIILDTPIDGEIYVEGQQVVVEDAEGNITEIGNVDEISNSTLEEAGIETKESDIKTSSDGNLEFEGTSLVPDKKGIKRNKRGEINRVVLTNQQGDVTKTLRGANAEEAAYQILLKEATSPEQAASINQLLEQDDKFREATTATETAAVTDTEQNTKQGYIQELIDAKQQKPEKYWTVSEVAPEVAASSTVIDTKDGAAVVKPDGDITGVFKKLTSKAKDIAQDLLKKAVEAGGTKLDNFDNYLTPIYEKAGFRVVGRVPFNEEFAPDGWKPEFGKPDVVAMIYDPNKEISITEETFQDYNEMIKYRDSYLEGTSIESKTEQEIIEEGVNNQLDNKEISKALKDNGFDANKSIDAIKKYREEFRKKGARASRIYDPTADIKAFGYNINFVRPLVNNIDYIYRAAVSNKGFGSKELQTGREVLNGFIEAEVRNAKIKVQKLNNILNKLTKEKALELSSKIDQVLRGDQTVELDENIKSLANEMRIHVDNLSKKLMESGAIKSSESRDVIFKNLGEYLNRSYKLYDSKDYAKTVSEEVKTAAKNKLKEMYREDAIAESQETGVDVETILDDRANSAVEKILSTNENESDAFFGVTKTGSKNKSILKKRNNDIPLEIRALMGEYGDPAMNYVRSVQKLAQLNASQDFLMKIKENGEGVYFFKKPQGKYNVEVAPKNSDTYSPLNGYHTTKEIKAAIEQQGLLDVQYSGPASLLFDVYLKSLGFVKETKTVLSVGTHAKNIIGNIPFLIANGTITSVEEYNNAMKVLTNEYKGLDNKELNEKMDLYTRLGIVNNSADLGELRTMIKRGKTFEDVMLESIASKKTAKQTTLSAIDKVRKTAQKFYRMEDDYFKVFAFEAEKKRFSKDMFGKDFSELTAEQQKESQDAAAEIVKNTLPNYNRTGPIVKVMKIIPVAGTFISFYAESLRTSFNIVNQGVKEMKNEKTRATGAKRIIGSGSLIAAQVAIMSLFGISSIGDEEEDDGINKKAKQFLPTWNKNASIVITDVKEGGKFSYISLSASDPFGGQAKAVNAAMSGEDLLDGFSNALLEFIEPFTSEDILKKMVRQLGSNKDDFGRDIVTEADSFDEAMIKRAAIIAKTLEPGTLTSIRKIAGQETLKDGMNEIIGQFTGFKVNDVDPIKQMQYKAYDIQDRASSLSSGYNKMLKEFRTGKSDITEKDLIDKYNSINEAKKKIYKEGLDIYQGALYLGANIRDVENALTRDGRGGIPKYILRGFSAGIIPDTKVPE